MRYNHTSRLLSVVLVLTLLIQMLPTQIFAAQSSNTIPTEQVDSTTPVTVVGEEVTLRDESEKHFRLSDGSFLAVTYGTPVHYLDNSGNWQDIDNRPVLVADLDGAESYQIANTDKSTSFSTALTDGTIFSASVGELSVSMQLLDTAQAIGDFSTIQMDADANAELITDVTKEELQVFSRNAVAELEENAEVISAGETHEGWQVSDLMPDNLTSSLVYEDVFPGVDLRYEASGYSIKEEIIIRQTQNSYRYDFLLTLDGLTARMNDDGSVDLLDADNTVIYEIPAPYMYDAAGEFSEEVAYVLREVDGGVILTVVAEDTWIHDAAREFPVTIDPTLNLIVYNSNNAANEGLYLTYVKESAPDRTAQGTKELWIGYGIATKELRGYIHVNKLPVLPAGSVVTHATLNLYMGTFNAGYISEIPLGIFEVTSAPSADQSYQDWIKYMTWNTKADYNDTNLIDYVTASRNTLYNKNNYGPMSWDMTELVKKWYSENTQNRTVTLGTTKHHTTQESAVCVFYAYDAQYAPSLVVSYRNNTGIEPYYTYTTLGAGAAGAAYIADATGQIRIVNSILGYSSGVNPFSLGIVYNSDYFASDAPADYQPLEELGLNMSVGSGWRLSCVEKIVPETISGTTYLKFYDGDGTIHYFLPKDNAYFDEDGLGLKIVSKGNNAYEMTDDYGNKWTFTNNFLTAISDETGNQILIQYADNRLTSIVQQNKNASQITIASFAYDEDNYLTSATDAAQNIYSLTYSGGRLISIAKNNTTLAQYGYSVPGSAESDNRIKQLTDTESGYQILLDYDASGKVSSFQEKAGNATGARVDITYPNYSQTVYKDYGVNQADANDDILTYYLFDHAGRTANAYTTDVFGNILGATNAVYSGSGSTDKTNNRTLRTASIGVAGQHLLKNPSFETADGWTLGSTRQQANARTGQYALSLTQEVTSSEVTLTEGKTYTFSAYVDTSAATGFSGRGVYVKASGGEHTWEGIPVNYQTSPDNQWIRVSVTFTAPSTGAYTFSICNDGTTGSVYADDVQLETGEAPSNYNLLENGNFSMGKTGWVSPETVVIDNGALKITGSPSDATANASQTVAINLPSTETFVLSGWVTADAVPDTFNTAADPAQDTNKQCGLRAALHYTDNTVEYHYVPFNTDLGGRQFVSYTLVPNPKDGQGNATVKTVQKIVVTCAYETNANIALFDDISLVREITQTMEYDDDGNLKSVTTSGLNTDLNTYQGGNLIKTVTGSQGVFEYAYDQTYTHRLNSVTNRATEDSQTEYITQSMTYDTVGNVTATTLSGPGGLTMSTSAQYTNQGNLISSVTDATGSTVSYQYGNADSVMRGLPTAVTAPDGTVTSSAYDMYGRVTQTNVDQLATLLYNYDDGNLETITRSASGKSQTYSLTYDAFGNTLSISVGDRTLAAYEYLAGNGLLRKQTYGNGHTVSFTYDNLGRTKTATYSDGTVLSYTYTGDGQLHSVTETRGENTTVYLYQYDTLGNLVGSEKLVGGAPVLRTWNSYDSDNRLSSQGWQIGSDSFYQTYTYGEWDGNLSSMRIATGQTETYSYDNLRRLSTVSNVVYTKRYGYRDLDSTRTTGQVETLTYDLPTDLTFSYTYDNMGNIVTYTDANGTATYTYDDLGQLTKAEGTETYEYSYDNAGNILSANGHTYTYGDSTWADLLTKVDGQSITYDAIGNPTSYYNGTSWSFTWARGRELAAASGNGKTVTYSYNADGLRTGKVVNGDVYEYYYAGDKLMRMTMDQNGTHRCLDFYYDASGPYAVKVTNATATTTYYYVKNLQGDIVAIVNRSGKVLVTYTYDPWGNVLSIGGEYKNGLGVRNPLRYRGYVYDNETQFYYLQSRYYDPELGRFLNADSYASTGQGVLGNNMFAYCGNNPVNKVDPAGTFFLYDWWNDAEDAIWKLGAKVLKRMGYDLTAELLELSASGPGNSYKAEADSPIAQKIASDEGFTNSVINAYNNGDYDPGEKIEYEFLVSDGDLGAALHWTSYTFETTTDGTTGTQYLLVTITDKFDFTEIKNPFTQGSFKAGFLWLANDIACIDMSWGLLDPVAVEIEVLISLEP